jgi:hypothetical protein
MKGYTVPDIKTDNIELLHNAIKSQSEWDMILMLHSFFASEGFVFKINPRGKIAFCYKSKKDFLIWRNSEIDTHLINIDKYQGKIKWSTENVKDTILNGLDCHDCENKCETQIKFEYEGVKYKKCNPKQGCYINFRFKNPAKDDVKSIIELIKFEIPYYKCTK